MVGKRRTARRESVEVPVDLASRIGGPAPGGVVVPKPVQRYDGPIDVDRTPRGRPLLIGANETAARSPLIDGKEPPARPVEVRESGDPADAVARPASPNASVSSSVREAPSLGEMDLVVTPLLTPDDWHHFELALRRLPGVGTLRTEYYRAGILKLRLRWSGAERLAEAVAAVPGYRVGILGEDRSTVQIRVVRSA